MSPTFDDGTSAQKLGSVLLKNRGREEKDEYEHTALERNSAWRSIPRSIAR